MPKAEQYENPQKRFSRFNVEAENLAWLFQKQIFIE